MKYQKLVRDYIPEIIRRAGSEPVTSIADDALYARKLREKLQEEVAEFLNSGKSEELADILEVLYALAREQGLSPEAVEELRVQKGQQRGSFQNRIILEEVKG